MTRKEPVFHQPFGWKRIRGAWHVLTGQANAYCLAPEGARPDDPHALIIPPLYTMTVTTSTTNCCDRP